MQQTTKTSFLKTLLAARRQTRPAKPLRELDRSLLGRVSGGGAEPGPETPKGGW
jgi:hypothetical protein